MAFSGTLPLTSDYVPGYKVPDSRSFYNSVVSRRIHAVVLPDSSCLFHKLHIENGHPKSAPNKMSFVCRASSSGHRRNNPDFSRNNKNGFRGRNRRNEDRDSLDGGGLEDSDMLSSRNGPVFSLSNSPKFQATSSPGPKEKEIVELFRKVQTQLRARAAAKKEEKKTEETSKGQGGKESETVDSLLKLLRKHSGEQSKKKEGSFNSEKQLHGDDYDDAAGRQDHSSNHYDSPNKDHDAIPFTRPASSFRRNSPVPRHKSQTSYSNEATFDEASSYSVTWTQKKDQVESPDEPEYEPELEPEPEYETESRLAIIESVSELKPESIYQEEDEDHDIAIDELSDDDESLQIEEEAVQEEDLSALKLIELRAIAKSRGLKGISKMKKAELLNLLVIELKSSDLHVLDKNTDMQKRKEDEDSRRMSEKTKSLTGLDKMRLDRELGQQNGKGILGPAPTQAHFSYTKLAQNVNHKNGPPTAKDSTDVAQRPTAKRQNQDSGLATSTRNEFKMHNRFDTLSMLSCH